MTEIGSKSIKMVALDLDGTTLNSQCNVSTRTIKALGEAAERGVFIVITTGRAYTALPEAVLGISGVKYAITSNGAHIYDLTSGDILFSRYLNEDTAFEALRIKRLCNCDIEVFINGTAHVDETYYRDVEINGCSTRNAEYILWSRRPVPDIEALLADNSRNIENVNFIFRDNDTMDRAAAELLALENASVTSAFPLSFELGGPDISKKAALVELLKRLGLTEEELMCCGDAPNDIEMIEFAGIGVAMANGWGGVKEHADYITASNDEDGVAAAVEKFILNLN